MQLALMVQLGSGGGGQRRPPLGPSRQLEPDRVELPRRQLEKTRRVSGVFSLGSAGGVLGGGSDAAGREPLQATTPRCGPRLRSTARQRRLALTRPSAT